MLFCALFQCSILPQRSVILPQNTMLRDYVWIKWILSTICIVLLSIKMMWIHEKGVNDYIQPHSVVLRHICFTLPWRHSVRGGVSITSLTIVYSTVYSDADQRKYQSSTSLAFMWGILRWPVNSLHRWPVTRKCCHLMTSSLSQQLTSTIPMFHFAHESVILPPTYHVPFNPGETFWYNASCQR